MNGLHYRPEIDGLRAIAVLPVVLYHLGFGLTGGYVGVDIFFVISGFLITSLITQDLAAGRFSLAEFWERRIRRIMPAAVVTVVVSLVLGSILLLPADLTDLAQSAQAQAVFGANMYFAATTDYFGAPAERKPLLHFWSLAVEEQFYLLFPLLLIALARYLARWQRAVVAAIALASLTWSAFAVQHAPEAAFFLLPARAWELAVGAWLALRRGALPLPTRWLEPLGWLGMALMIVPCFTYTAATPFPGLAALPPCIGAVLVIGATRPGQPSVLRAVLSVRPLVFIGLISYSLYLWHWPVQVYSHYWLVGRPPVSARLMVLLFTLALAVASWRWIEQPFRRARAAQARRTLWTWAGATTAFVLSAGFGLAWQKGWPERFPEVVLRYAAAVDDRPRAEEADVDQEDLTGDGGDGLPELVEGAAGPVQLLLWGDSHARVVSPALEVACGEAAVRAVRASRSATHALLHSSDGEKRQHNEHVLAWIRENRPAAVVLVSRWITGIKTHDDQRRLIQTVGAIRATGAQVWILRPLPFPGQDVPISLARSALLRRPQEEIPLSQHEWQGLRANEAIDRVQQLYPDTIVLDPVPYLSADGTCVIEDAGRPLYYDEHHLTRVGAARLEPLFREALRRLPRPAKPRTLAVLNAQRAPGH